MTLLVYAAPKTVGESIRGQKALIWTQFVLQLYNVQTYTKRMYYTSSLGGDHYIARCVTLCNIL